MSDGPIAIIHRWSSNSSSATASADHYSFYFWLKAGATGLVFGLLANHLRGYGELLWEDASWVLCTFFILYTLFLVLTVSYLSQTSVFNQSSNEKQICFTPSCPPGLTRLRSYLAFFPITHVIHQHAGGGESGKEGRGEKVGLESMSAAGNFSADIDHQGLSFRINAQMDMAIEAIVSEYIFPWYTKISDDRSFLEQCKAIIQAVFLQLGEKLRQVDRNELAKEAIQIVHVHWKEYTDALGKCQQPNGDDISKTFKFVHPFLQDGKEVSRRYQNILRRVLEELAIPDLSSPVMCQFLAGVVVKNFILYYVEMLSQPSWINGAFMSLLSSGSMSVTGSSSQNSSSPASPLPEVSPKALNMFSDEVIECASICPTSSTGDSTPTKKSRNSSGRSVSGQSQDDSLTKGEQQESKHLFDQNISSSIEDASSASEPKTESSPGTTETTESASPSPTEKKFPHKSSGGGSSGGLNMTTTGYEADLFLVRSKRPKDLMSLKPAVPAPSSLRTLSTALGSVMQATALPLLPSECYTEENNLALPIYCQPSLQLASKSGPKGRQVLEEISESDNESQIEDNILVDAHSEGYESDAKFSPNESDTQEGNTEPESMKNVISSGEDDINDSPSDSKSVNTTSHYYSFDEASKPKSASTSLFESSTLSLDGALDQSKRQASQDQLQLCSHEFKTELNSSGKPNRSPVYEEPEDFAASIAKLRSLLEQKGRKSSTPPPLSAPANMGGEVGDVFESPPSSSPSTAPSSANKVEKPVMCVENIPQISETCCSESHTTPSSTSSMENSKETSHFSFNEPIMIPLETDSTMIDTMERTNYESVPEIKCCFRNVTIPKVENSADAGGQYMFYCIQYEGVYFDDKEDGGPQQLVYRTTTIKRKFKEFLTLQAHLEENAACKPHLKGIKTPTRWTNVSLTKSDAIVANQRRAMLEKYLQQLCYHPIIGFCQEVMVFMAYGEDGFCSFEVGDPKDLLTHRLDKLARKFTGVINSLKDALPSFELDLSPAPNTPKSEGITPCDLKLESSFPSFPFQEKYSSLPHDKDIPLERPWDDKFSQGWTSNNPESLKEDDKKSNEILGESVAFTQPEIEGMEEGKIFSAYPLAAAVTQLLCDVLWLPQYRPHPASVATFMSISGKSLENYVLETMDIFLSDEAILGYLEWLTISVNNGQSDTDSRYDGEFFSEQDLKNIVKRRIPGWVRWMWGRSRLDLTIDRVTGLFQNPVVNHDLILSLCELLFSKMVNVEESSSE